jgi:hypothetical protein
MASLLARALTPDRPHGDAGDSRSGIDRVLRATFWQSNVTESAAAVIPITTPTARGTARKPSTPTRG